jgi:hypothetical protein
VPVLEVLGPMVPPVETVQIIFKPFQRCLRKMIWAEADKLGYFINTVTDPVLAKEKQVVKMKEVTTTDLMEIILP